MDEKTRIYVLNLVGGLLDGYERRRSIEMSIDQAEADLAILLGPSVVAGFRRLADDPVEFCPRCNRHCAERYMSDEMDLCLQCAPFRDELRGAE